MPKFFRLFYIIWIPHIQKGISICGIQILSQRSNRHLWINFSLWWSYHWGPQRTLWSLPQQPLRSLLQHRGLITLSTTTTTTTAASRRSHIQKLLWQELLLQRKKIGKCDRLWKNWKQFGENLVESIWYYWKVNVAIIAILGLFTYDYTIA